jgi:hydrogenase maturation protein HypF
LREKKVKSRKESTGDIRYKIKIYGIVQGVGFRPFVYKKAKEFQIYGWAQNVGGAINIDCTGKRDSIKQFISDILKKPPSLAKIEKVQCTFMRSEMMSHNEASTENFIIRESVNEINQIKFVSPDVAICPKCLEDIESKGTYRYRYAFTNCTDCGPRYSIIKALPYDRHYTTMEDFHMCGDCHSEYDNPLSRRFHAQPNCCEKCGPKLFLTDSKGKEIHCEDAIKETIKLLEGGNIIAIKGLGGFHLVCDGRSEQAIMRLRSRKHRIDKPLALMAKDMGIIKEICHVSEKEQVVLESNKRPIVILRKKFPSDLPVIIAPTQNKLGLMLPYTPLHHLLFNQRLNLLIMTSGNISGNPIEYINEDAVKHLGEVVDYFLMNDRKIYSPIDDSVVKIFDETESIIRRARGYAPYAMKVETKLQILALGGQQKNTICVSKNGYAYLSQYLGDLENFNSYENFKGVLRNFSNLFDIHAEILVHDFHPTYLSTKYAKKQKMRKIQVQHHHAHMVSCMAEHSIYDAVIGVIFDGTGLGLDGAIWGGEFFIGTRNSFKRVGQLEYVKIQGGEQAIKEPWRCAVSYLETLGYDSLEIIKDVEREKIQVVTQAFNAELNCFVSSSIGRLFDTVAALIGIRNNITYDGQAAIELENIIEVEIEESYPWNIQEKGGVFHLQYKDIVEGVLKDLQRKEPAYEISAKFHNSLAEATCALVCQLREREGLNKVVLSGGVFENQYLLKKVYKNLIKRDFEVFHNEQIPINDGGLSFGQLHVASAMLEKEGEKYVSCHTSSDYEPRGI